jgi:hypothetical protein
MWSMRLPRNFRTSRVAPSAQCTSSITATVAGRPRSIRSKMASSRSPRGAGVARSSRNRPPDWMAMSRRGPSVRGVDRSSHPPQSTGTPGRLRSANPWTSAVLPMPASPLITTTDPVPREARPRAASSSPSSRSRSRRSMPRSYRDAVPHRRPDPPGERPVRRSRSWTETTAGATSPIHRAAGTRRLSRTAGRTGPCGVGPRIASRMIASRMSERTGPASPLVDGGGETSGMCRAPHDLFDEAAEAVGPVARHR